MISYTSTSKFKIKKEYNIHNNILFLHLDLLRRKPNLIHKEDVLGYTAVIWAAMGSHLTCLQYLVEHGAIMVASVGDQRCVQCCRRTPYILLLMASSRLQN